MFCLAAVLFDIAFPAIFQSWLDVLSVLSMDLYTFVGECTAPIPFEFPMGTEFFETAQVCTVLLTSTCTMSLLSP